MIDNLAINSPYLALAPLARYFASDAGAGGRGIGRAMSRYGVSEPQVAVSGPLPGVLFVLIRHKAGPDHGT
jgi:hypothetical protein